MEGSYKLEFGGSLTWGVFFRGVCGVTFKKKQKKVLSFICYSLSLDYSCYLMLYTINIQNSRILEKKNPPLLEGKKKKKG